VAFTVENDVSFDPADISLLGAEAVMLQTEAITHLVEQLGGRGAGFFWLFQVIGHGWAY
jgi:hypothetical protein